MDLRGQSIVNFEISRNGRSFTAFNPLNGQPLAPEFYSASLEDVDRAARVAERAFKTYSRWSGRQKAELLRQIAADIEALGNDLIECTALETALSQDRLRGELARTSNQLRLFASVAEEGSWVGARIDRADPGRKPAPKPDLRSMLRPLGPVAVFGASNFPLAFSVAGGDTASALAAGNPVVVKAHPAHPGTCELVARAIQSAVQATQMPAGVFSLLHGASHEVSLGLVRHPAAKAVGFTGSLKAGRALFDAAAARPEPIPVYAEMGSTNPVFVLPGALQNNAAALAEGFVQSVTFGVGPF